MAEYINKQDIIDYLNRYLHSLGEAEAVFDRGQCRAIVNVLQDITAVKAADVQEVRHGHWKISCDGYYPYCSVCKGVPESRLMTDYCPSCGARMDGGDE